MGKIFERAAIKRRVSLHQNDKFISLIKNKSTRDALVILVDYVYQKLDNTKAAVELYLDLAQAFDKINHDIL